MSRVGKKPIEIPKDVKVNITDSAVEVQGPKGKLTTAIPAGVNLKVDEGKLVAERQDDDHTAIHGTVRALIANAIKGVSQGFSQEMDVVGVGYKAELKGRSVQFGALLDWTRAHVRGAPQGSLVLIEGAGGIMSPLTPKNTNLDLLAALGAPLLTAVGGVLAALRGRSAVPHGPSMCAATLGAALLALL